MINKDRFTLNKKVFWAITASILGTIGSLAVGNIFFDITKEKISTFGICQ